MIFSVQKPFFFCLKHSLVKFQKVLAEVVYFVYIRNPNIIESPNKNAPKSKSKSIHFPTNVSLGFSSLVYTTGYVHSIRDYNLDLWNGTGEKYTICFRIVWFYWLNDLLELINSNFLSGFNAFRFNKKHRSFGATTITPINPSPDPLIPRILSISSAANETEITPNLYVSFKKKVKNAQALLIHSRDQPNRLT